ncbi:TylF/MycF family methyltransferase [Patescibacteria group bacterium]|nr:TylF/MycF family methyltransferase [Patescibacteria group bacterium]
MKQKIAWGTSKLLKMYLAQTESNPFSYCIDDFSKAKSIYGLKINKSKSLLQEKKGLFQIVIFAVSNKSLQEISHKLNQMGLDYAKDFIYYSDFFYDSFVKKASKYLGFKLNPRIYQYALSFTLNSLTLVHTTILGTWLFLEILNKINGLKGQIAEVGIFQGGNALGALHFMTNLKNKKFYLFDSFEGFPELSQYDPSTSKKGDYDIETTYQKIVDTFFPFKEVKLIKGFIPKTFNQIPKNERFSLVFYDCDLYQPAIDTFNFFWQRIIPGGYLIIHDYQTEEGGFTGVKKATDEFFKDKKVKLFSFFENTMAVIKK